MNIDDLPEPDRLDAMALEKARTQYTIYGLTGADGERIGPYFKQAYSWQMALQDALANEGVRELELEDVFVLDFFAAEVIADSIDEIVVVVESRYVEDTGDDGGLDLELL